MIPSPIEEIIHRAERSQEDWTGFTRWLACQHPSLAREMLDDSRVDWRFLLPRPPEARVLELSCGWGNLALSLADSGGAVYAVDFDAMHVRWVAARAKMTGLRNVSVSLADLRAPIFPSSGFDLIVVQDLRWLLPDSRPPNRLLCDAGLRALTTMKELLNPGGILVLRLESSPSGRGTRRYFSSVLAAFRRLSVQRVQDALHRSGLGWTKAFLALPSCTTSAYLLDVTAPGSLRPALRFLAGHFIEPKNLKRLIARWTLLHAPFPSAHLASVAGCWLIGASSPSAKWLSGIGGTAWLGTGDDSPLRLGTMAIRGNADHHSRAHIATFEERSGRGCAIVHIARSREEPYVITREHENLCLIGERLSTPMKATVPSPIGLSEVHGRPAIALGWIDGMRLSDLLRKAMKAQSMTAVSSLFPVIVAWLARFEEEMGSFARFDESLLREHIIAPIEAFIAGCNPALELAERARRLATEAEAFLGQQVLLTAEHGDFWHRNILMRSGAASSPDQVSVIDWELASFERLPFADLYSLVISTALLLLGDDAEMLHGQYALRFAYSGESWFSRLVDTHLEAYAAQINMDRSWGAILLPLSHMKVATLHQAYFRDALAPKWMDMAEFCLHRLYELPVATGQKGNASITKPGSRA